MIKEILAKAALSPSRLPGLDYALNPYRGCSHACIYCYAPSVIHWDSGKWGELVEAKVNLPRILSRELRTGKKGVVGLGTVTDPYQPAEEKHEITRRCLELLLSHDLPVCIQTKSSLVLRDLDLLKKFSDVEVGITLTTPDEKVRIKLEPGASSIEERIHTLHELSRNGINTWVFSGPLMPYIIDIEALIDSIAEEKPGYVLVDRLRLKEGVWERVKEFIKAFDPHLIAKYDRIFFENGAYYEEVFRNINKKCIEKGLDCRMMYHENSF